MRHNRAAGSFIAAACTISAWLGASESSIPVRPEPTVLRLCYSDSDSRPWHYARGGGLDVLLLDRAAKKVGVRLTYHALPWKSCLAQLSGNKVDGVFGEELPPVPVARNKADGGRVLGSLIPLHVSPHGRSGLLFSLDIIRHRPELAVAISHSLARVRAETSYTALERNTLVLLGGT